MFLLYFCTAKVRKNKEKQEKFSHNLMELSLFLITFAAEIIKTNEKYDSYS